MPKSTILLLLLLFFNYSSGLIYILSNTDNGTFKVTAPFMQGLTNLTVTNSTGRWSCNITSIVTDPCRISYQRVDACQAVYNSYGGYVPVLNELCEGPAFANETCIYSQNVNIPCPPQNISNICSRPRCFQATGSGGQECVSYIQPLSGYQCGETSVCDGNLTCVDARGNECNSVVTCQGLPSLDAGAYNISFVSETMVALQRPEVNDIAPLIASPGARLLVNATVTSADFASVQYYWIGTAMDGIMNDTIPDVGLPSGTSGDLVAIYTYHVVATNTIISFNVTLASVTTYRVPLLYTLCPGTALEFINTTIVINGDEFINTALLQCLFGNQLVPVVFYAKDRIGCIVNPTNDSIGLADISVSNDGGNVYSSKLHVNVIGACFSIKPGSIPMGDACSCPPGSYDTGLVCTPCYDGTYQPRFGQQSCLSCDSSMNTGGLLGSTDPSACRCRDGKFRLRPTDNSCQTCVEGLSCVNGTTTVVSGWWRASNAGADSSILVKCTATTTTGGRCTGGNSSASGNQLCAVGYEGPLCQVCSVGYGKLGAGCTKCHASGLDGFIVFLMFLAASIGIFLLVRATTTVMSSDTRSATAAITGGVSSVIKIMLNYIQLLYYLGTLSSAQWSDKSLNFFAIFLPMSVSPSFASIQCAAQMSFYTRMGVTMVLPILAALILLILFVLIYLFVSENFLFKHEFSIDRDSYFLVLYVILYVMHPMIWSAVSGSLNCLSVPGTGAKFVISDMSINCDSAVYKHYFAGAIVFVIVYIFGLPLYIGWKMQHNKDDIFTFMSGAAQLGKPTAYRYIYFVRGYDRLTYLWEGLVLFRKLGIVAIASFMTGPLQLAWCGLVIIVSLAKTINDRPYNTILDTRLELISLWALLSTLFVAWHSAFATGPDKDTFALFFLVITNCSALLLMIMGAFQRFRRQLGTFVRDFLDFFSSRTLRVNKDVNVEMQKNPMIYSVDTNKDTNTSVVPNTEFIAEW